jgi:hypothetical protein
MKPRWDGYRIGKEIYTGEQGRNGGKGVFVLLQVFFKFFFRKAERDRTGAYDLIWYGTRLGRVPGMAFLSSGWDTLRVGYQEADTMGWRGSFE